MKHNIKNMLLSDFSKLLGGICLQRNANKYFMKKGFQTECGIFYS